jgi:hypothetical protein
MQRRARAYPSKHIAVHEYEEAIGGLRRVNAEVLAAAEQRKSVTTEAVLAKSELELGIGSLLHGWPGTTLGA